MGKKILVPCLDVLYVVDVTVANNKLKTMVLYDFLFGEGGGGGETMCMMLSVKEG